MFRIFGFASRFHTLFFMSFIALVPLGAVTLEDVMNAALLNDSSLADAKSKLKIAENNLFKSSSLNNTSLSLSGSLKGQAGDSQTVTAPNNRTAADTSLQKSVSANLSIPFAKWLILGIEGSTDTEVYSGSVSLSLIPLAKTDSQAEIAWNKAVIDAQNAVRNTLLSVRKEYRLVLTARAEYEFRKAAALSAQNELSRIQYLVELGNARKSESLTVYSDLMDAQGFLDTAENNVNIAVQNLSLRTGLSEASFTDFLTLAIPENRTLVNVESWVAGSAEMAIANLNLESVRRSNAQGTALPDLTLGTNMTDTLSYSVTAKVSFSPDMIFQKTKDSTSENLVIQQRSCSNTERSVRTAWQNQQTSLVMAERNVENANRFMESAKMSYTETELLLEKGDSSRASLDSANEKMLSALYQLQKAVESLENTRDILDQTWQLQLEF